MSPLKSLSIFTFAIFYSATTSMSIAHATGNDVGHGGNTVFCANLAPVTLDYYNASLKTLGGATPDLLDLDRLSSDQVIALIKQQFAYRYIFLDALNTALSEIGPMANWISTDLKQVDDSDEPYYLPAGCTRETAAIRQDPFQMYGDPTVINALSDTQKGLLMLHEALYLLAAQKGQNTSTSVRDFFRTVLQKNPSPSDLTAKIQELQQEPTDFSGAVNFLPGTFVGTILDYANAPAGSIPISNETAETCQILSNPKTYQVHLNCFPATEVVGLTLTADCSAHDWKSGLNPYTPIGEITCTTPKTNNNSYRFRVSADGTTLTIDQYATTTNNLETTHTLKRQ